MKSAVQQAVARRSSGEMLRDGEVDRQDSAPGRGKLAKLFPGKMVLYRGPLPKTCRLGKVQSVLQSEGAAVVHRYKPVSDGALDFAGSPSC